MTRLTLFTLAFLLLVLSTACSSSVQNSPEPSSATPVASPPNRKITSESVVKVSAPPVEIPAGGSAEAIVSLSIESGFHVNANPPTFPYLKATQLEIAPAAGLTVKTVSYPKALQRRFVFAEKPLAVYEGDTELKVSLMVDGSAAKGDRSLPAKLRIQACDEEVCYPPGTLDLTIPIRIK